MSRLALQGRAVAQGGAADKLPSSRWERTVLALGGMVEEVNALRRRIEGDIIVFGGVGFVSALVVRAEEKRSPA